MTPLHLDFELVLVALTLLCGVIWSVDKFWLAKRRGEDEKVSVVVDYGRSFFSVLLIVLLLRSFVIEPFRIPSGSMLPTLTNGDFILVNKFSYGLRLPVTHHKLLDVGGPDYGDVAVFRFPPDPSLDYIKRIVGKPGDVIEYANKTLYVNGERQPYKLVGDYQGIGSRDGDREFDHVLVGHEHKILINRNLGSRGRGPARWTVPDGHYFAVGDNRDNSMDSRFWGFVPEQNLVGRAFFIWMNLNGDWGRIGTSID